jgi:hypothetical protein
MVREIRIEGMQYQCVTIAGAHMECELQLRGDEERRGQFSQGRGEEAGQRAPGNALAPLPTQPPQGCYCGTSKQGGA